MCVSLTSRDMIRYVQTLLLDVNAERSSRQRGHAAKLDAFLHFTSFSHPKRLWTLPPSPCPNTSILINLPISLPLSLATCVMLSCTQLQSNLRPVGSLTGEARSLSFLAFVVKLCRRHRPNWKKPVTVTMLSMILVGVDWFRQWFLILSFDADAINRSWNSLVLCTFVCWGVTMVPLS